MDKRIPIGVVIGILIIFGALWAYGNLDDILFEQIPYYYTSYTELPANSADGGSLGGYYTIEGQGKHFVFHIAIPGAELFDLHEVDGTLICYDDKGLSGNGTIKTIDITWETILALLQKDVKKAMFETRFTGDYKMTCAAWNGTGNFSNDGKNFNGTFDINGIKTFFGGVFKLKNQNNKIVLDADYIYYPQGQPDKAKKVSKTFYM